MTQHRGVSQTPALGSASGIPLNTSRDGDSTTSLGSPFQCLIALSVKNFLLMSKLNFPWCTLRLCPPILSETSQLFVPRAPLGPGGQGADPWEKGQCERGAVVPLLEGSWAGGSGCHEESCSPGPCRELPSEGSRQSSLDPGGHPARVTRSSARSPSEAGMDRGSAATAIEPVRAP